MTCAQRRLRSAWADKTNKMTCAPSEDSDQPGHPPRLIWVFAGRTFILLVLSWGGSNDAIWFYTVCQDLQAVRVNYVIPSQRLTLFSWCIIVYDDLQWGSMMNSRGAIGLKEMNVVPQNERTWILFLKSYARAKMTTYCYLMHVFKYKKFIILMNDMQV